MDHTEGWLDPFLEIGWRNERLDVTPRQQCNWETLRSLTSAGDRGLATSILTSKKPESRDLDGRCSRTDSLLWQNWVRGKPFDDTCSLCPLATRSIAKVY